MDLKTRPGKKGDEKQLAALWQSYDQLQLQFLGFNFDERAMIDLAELYIEKHISFGMWLNDELIGGIMGYIAPLVFDPRTIMFHEILWYVKQDHRMYSIKLIKDFEAYISPKVDKIEMCNWATIDCKKAARLYQRLGYTLLEQRFIKET